MQQLALFTGCCFFLMLPSAHSMEPAVASAPTMPTLIAPALPVVMLSDHMLVRGHTGWLASFSPFVSRFVFSGGTNAQMEALTSVELGLRHWFHAPVGIDAKFSLQVLSSESSVKNPGQSASVTHELDPSLVTASIGVPIALLPTAHTVLNIIPNISLGASWATLTGETFGTVTGQVGLAIGPEIHLGYFGMPELAILPTFGASLYASGGMNNTGTNTNTQIDYSAMGISVATFGVNFTLLHYPGAG